jgi:hypothetical protein
LISIVRTLRAAGRFEHFENPQDVFTLYYGHKRLASGALEMTVFFDPTKRLTAEFAAFRASKSEGGPIPIRESAGAHD